jgi:type II secretory pathway pseudopilin PulG
MTLLETMVVIALLGVLVAIASPDLVRQLHKARVNAAAEQLAGLVDAARSEAMASKRCARVYVAGAGTRIVIERLNSFDCDQSPETAFRIDGRPVAPNTTWTLVKEELVDGWENVLASIEVVPTELIGTPPGAGAVVAEVRFRPNGRVWGQNSNLDDDDAILAIRHRRLAEVKRVLVEGNGLLCVLRRNEEAPGGPDYTCPPR